MQKTDGPESKESLERRLRGAAFVETRWSLIGRIVGAEGSQRNPAIDELLTLYLPVLSGHLIRKYRMDQNQADDLLQEFVLRRILEKNLISKADRKRGRFRSLLLSSLDRFVIDSFRRDDAEKRLPENARSLEDFDRAISKDSSSEADAFDSLWAQTVLQDTLRHMRQQYDQSDPAWTVFCYRVLLPVFNNSDPIDYQTLSLVCGLESERQAANYLVTAKRCFVRCLRAVVGIYISDEKEIDGEITELQRVVAAHPPSIDQLIPYGEFEDLRRSLSETGRTQFAAGGIGLLFEAEPIDPVTASIQETLQTPLRRLIPAETSKPRYAVWADRSLRQLLQDKKPPVELLKAVKQTGHGWAMVDGNNILAQVGATIYFVSIAVSVVCCGSTITSLTPRKLEFGIQQVMRLTELDSPFVTVLEKCLLWNAQRAT